MSDLLRKEQDFIILDTSIRELKELKNFQLWFYDDNGLGVGDEPGSDHDHDWDYTPRTTTTYINPTFNTSSTATSNTSIVEDQYAIVYDLLSEGEIEGLVDDSLENVSFNLVSIYNDSTSSYKFNNAYAELVKGADGELPTSKVRPFSGANYLSSVNSPMVWSSSYGGTGSPISLTPTHFGMTTLQAAEVDTLQLNIELPRGLYSVDKEADYRAAVFGINVKFNYLLNETWYTETLIGLASEPPWWYASTSNTNTYSEAYCDNWEYDGGDQTGDAYCTSWSTRVVSTDVTVTKGRASAQLADNNHITCFQLPQGYDSYNRDSGVLRIQKRSKFIYEVTLNVADLDFEDWTLDIHRTTPDTKEDYLGSDTLSGDVAIQANLNIAEAFISDKFSYPNSAYAITSFAAQDFPQPPQRSFLIRGKKVKVPSNYTTRESIDSGNPLEQQAYYSGFWDGSFKAQKEYTNNPVWVFYDLVTNPRYGLGGFLSEDDIDIYTLYEISKYCDELVPDGKGGVEPRFVCNLYLSKAEESYKVLSDLASVFRAMVHWIGGKATLVQDKPKEPLYTFSSSNVIDGQFSYEYTGQRARINQVNVRWNDPLDNYKQKVLIVDDIDNIIDTGRIVPKDAVAFGTTSEGQARRLGNWHLLTNALETEVCSFRTSINAGFLIPGDLIKIQDSFTTKIQFSGRLREGATTTILPIDREITIDDTEPYWLYIVMDKPGCYLQQDSATISSVEYSRGDLLSWVLTEEDSVNVVDDSGVSVKTSFAPHTRLERRLISNTSGTYTNLSTLDPFSEVPDKEAIWALATTKDSQEEGNAKTFRILGIKEESDNIYGITASTYYEEKYDELEKGWALSDNPYYESPYTDAVVPPPTNLHFRFRGDGTAYISWEPPLEEQVDSNDNVVLAPYKALYGFEILYNVTWDSVDNLQSVVIPKNVLEWDVPGIRTDIGDYTVKIRSIDTYGKVSEWLDVQDTPIAETFGIAYGGYLNQAFSFKDGRITLPGDYKYTTPLGDIYTVVSGTEAQTNIDFTNVLTTAGDACYWYLDESDSVSPWKPVYKITDTDTSQGYLSNLYAEDNGLMACTGTVSIDQGNNNLVGIGTLFSTELAPGMLIKISNQFMTTVRSIVSDTEITLNTIAPVTVSGVSFQKRNWVADPTKDAILGKVEYDGTDYILTPYLEHKGIDGENAPSIIFSNRNVSLIRNEDGIVGIASSSTTIDVYSGPEHLVYDDTSSSLSSYKVEINTTETTVSTYGTLSNDGVTTTLSAMTGDPGDSGGVIALDVTIISSTGAENTYLVYQTIAIVNEASSAWNVTTSLDSYKFVPNPRGIVEDASDFICNYLIRKDGIIYTFDDVSPYDENSWRFGTITESDVNVEAALGHITVDRVTSNICTVATTMTAYADIEIIDNASGFVIAEKRISFTKDEPVLVWSTDISNSNHTFYADTDGTADGTTFDCSFDIRINGITYAYDDSAVMGDSYKYGTLVETNVVAVVNTTTGVITLNASSPILSGTTITEGSLTVPIIDNYDGSTIANKVITFTKVMTGADGTVGYNAATLTAYLRSATTPTSDPGDVTYTFSTASWTPGNSWEKAIPVGTLPVYAVSASAYSNTDTYDISSTDWSTPALIAESGLNVSSVFIYQRTTTDSAPAKPTNNTTYTFADGSLTSPDNGWTAEIPTYTTGFRYLWVSIATASSTEDTDVIAPSEWADVRLLSDVPPAGSRGGSIFTFEESTSGIEASTVVDWVGTLTDTAAQDVAAEVIADTNLDGFIRPNDRITVSDESAELSATRIYIGSATDSSTAVAATNFSSVITEYVDGSMIVDGTLSAETLAANSTITNDLNVASRLTLNNVGGTGILNSRNKTAFDDTDAGFYVDTDGYVNIGNSTNYISFNPATGDVNIVSDGNIHLGNSTNYLDFDEATGDMSLAAEGTITLNAGSSGYSNISDAPTDLSGLDSVASDKLDGIAEGADNTANAISARTQVYSGGLRVIDNEYNRYAEITPGSVGLFRNNVLYTALSRTETGDCTTGTPVYFSPPFISPPNVICVIKRMAVYSNGTYDNYIEIEAANITTDGFEPRGVYTNEGVDTLNFPLNIDLGYNCTAILDTEYPAGSGVDNPPCSRYIYIDYHTASGGSDAVQRIKLSFMLGSAYTYFQYVSEGEGYWTTSVTEGRVIISYEKTHLAGDWVAFTSPEMYGSYVWISPEFVAPNYTTGFRRIRVQVIDGSATIQSADITGEGGDASITIDMKYIAIEGGRTVYAVGTLAGPGPVSPDNNEEDVSVSVELDGGIFWMVLADSGLNSYGLRHDGSLLSTTTTSFDNELNIVYVHALATEGERVVIVKEDGTADISPNNIDLSSWTDIVKATVGNNCVLGLKSDGTVVTAGTTYDLGTDPATWTGVVDIATSNNDAFGVKDDGTVYHAYWSGTSLDTSLWTDVASICCDIISVYGLKSDGTVLYTGSNDTSSWADIVDISACSGDVYGLQSDGRIVSLGDTAATTNGVVGMVTIQASDSGVISTTADRLVVTTGGSSYIDGVSDWDFYSDWVNNSTVNNIYIMDNNDEGVVFGEMVVPSGNIIGINTEIGVVGSYTPNADAIHVKTIDGASFTFITMSMYSTDDSTWHDLYDYASTVNTVYDSGMDEYIISVTPYPYMPENISKIKLEFTSP